MRCPLKKEKEIGDNCQQNNCWYWHKNSKCNCSITDTNSDHLLITDIYRIYKESEADSEKRVALGREKIKQWLKLLEILEIVDPKGCSRCGKNGCKNKTACNNRCKRQEKIKQLPLENILSMYPARWYAALKLIENNNILQSLKI